MNQPSNHNTNHTQAGSSFSSQQAPQSNPFTADLKGEFTSNFGTNTNAVSQIFKDGGFASGNNTRLLVLGGVFLVLVAVAVFFMFSEDEYDDLASNDPDAIVDPLEPVESATNTVTDPSAEAMAEGESMQEDVDGMAMSSAGAETAAMPTGNVMLVSPVDGDSRSYDETAGPAIFSWEGGAGTIVFSRDRGMKSVYMRVPTSGNSYEFHHPYPGTWFWQVETADGVSEVRSFRVQAPLRRNISLTAPLAGAAIAGNGGVISWTGDSKVAFYRVEFSADGQWGNPAYRFATSSETVQTQNVNPGQYEMRLGAFSEVAGRWEYTQPTTVTVQ